MSTTTRTKTPRRPWTREEIRHLQRAYKSSTATEIAVTLGRTPKAVYLAVAVYGSGKSHRTEADSAFLEALRRHNTDGLSDTEIAAELGCERHTVTRHRQRLGLPSNAYGERFKSRIAAATRQQCEAAGVASLGEVRAVAFQGFAEGRGWPSDLPPRAVMMLDALAAHGPMTRVQIASAIGMEWRGSRSSLKCRGAGGTYLAQLIAKGLVIRLGRLCKGQGKGHSTNLYSLALTTEREAPHVGA